MHQYARESRAVTFGRALGRTLGQGMRFVRGWNRDNTGPRLRKIVRQHPESLAGVAAAGFLLGRALRGR